MGIDIEIADHTQEVIEKNLLNPCQMVYFYAPLRSGAVSVWRSGFMDLEIIDNETLVNVYYQHYDGNSNTGDFDVLLFPYFNIMIAE